VYGEFLTGGAAEIVAHQVQAGLGWEARHVELGHLQRAGSPVAMDRILALRLGARAAGLAVGGRFGQMAAMQNGEIVQVAFAEAVAHNRRLSDHFLDRYEFFFSPDPEP
jgi:6-phosphofructokinase 1